MPTYDWKCHLCGFVFSGFIAAKDKEFVNRCPMCEEPGIEQIIAPPKIHFHHTEKEIRVPSKATKVYIKKD